MDKTTRSVASACPTTSGQTVTSGRVVKTVNWTPLQTETGSNTLLGVHWSQVPVPRVCEYLGIHQHSKNVKYGCLLNIVRMSSKFRKRGII